MVMANKQWLSLDTEDCTISKFEGTEQSNMNIICRDTGQEKFDHSNRKVGYRLTTFEWNKVTVE